MMSLFKNLFGKLDPEPRTPIEDRSPDFKFVYADLGTISISPAKKRLHFAAEIELANNAVSPNQKYSLEWEHGRFCLKYMGKIIKSGKMIDPNDGKVANNGVFVLNNWGNNNFLSGTFVAFNGTGEKTMSHYIHANLFNNGLSENGCFAVCQACNNKDHPDGGKLFIFDLVAGKLIRKIILEHGWADSYHFDTETRILYLEYRNKKTYTTSF